MVAAEVDVAVVPGTVAAVVPGTVAAVPEAVVAKGAVGVPWRVAVLVSEAARNSTQILRPPRGRLSRALVGCLTCLLFGTVCLRDWQVENGRHSSELTPRKSTRRSPGFVCSETRP